MSSDMSTQPRTSGVLAPIFSLPGTRDLGAFGAPVVKFFDFLRDAEQTYFQTLPISPIDANASPYAGRSAFAGETLYLDLEEFRREGLLDDSDLDVAFRLPERPQPGDSSDPQRDPRSERIDYAQARSRRTPLHFKAFERYQSKRGGETYRAAEDVFRAQNADWIDDYALFQVAAETFGSHDWRLWPVEIRRREPNALREFARRNRDALDRVVFLQLAFDLQWREIRRQAADRGLIIFGDLPIYVGRFSADAWARPELFMIDRDGNMLVEAGAPADDFNPDGQPWNSPTYRWSRHKATGYEWWKRRVAKTLERFDLARLDHFIGFYNYYGFPRSDSPDWPEERAAAFKAARPGDSFEPEWTPGPGRDFFDALFEEFDQARFVAEDLGVMNRGVRELRDHYALYGMLVAQFALGAFKRNPDADLFANWKPNYVAYTGTHDAQPIIGWLDDLAQRRSSRRLFRALERLLATTYARAEDSPATTFAVSRREAFFNRVKACLPIRRKLGVDPNAGPASPRVLSLHAPILRAVANSPCQIAIFPLQDVLGLGDDSRVNFPGVAAGNWTWRVAQRALTPDVAAFLREITRDARRQR